MVKAALVAAVVAALIVGIAGTYGFFSATGPAAQKVVTVERTVERAVTQTVVQTVTVTAAPKKIFEGQEIKIGYVMSITGRVAAFGKSWNNAIKMAVEEINAAGGILGGKFVPVIEDDQSSPDVSAVAVEKLITRDKVVVVVGAISSDITFVASVAAERLETPILTPTSGADSIIERDFKWFFMLSKPVSGESADLADFVTAVAGKGAKVAVLVENTLFAKTIGKFFVERAEKNGLKIVFNEAYSLPVTDYTPFLVRIKTSEPDVIATGALPLADNVLLRRQLRELDVNAKMFLGFGSTTVFPDFAKQAGRNADYMFTYSPWTEDANWSGLGGTPREYQDKYVARYGEKSTYHAAEAYVATYLIKDAIERARSLDKAAIRKALSETNLLNSMFGAIRFDERGANVVHPTPVLQWLPTTEGIPKQVSVWPTEFATVKFLYPTPKWSER